MLNFSTRVRPTAKRDKTLPCQLCRSCAEPKAFWQARPRGLAMTGKPCDDLAIRAKPDEIGARYRSGWCVVAQDSLATAAQEISSYIAPAGEYPTVLKTLFLTSGSRNTPDCRFAVVSRQRTGPGHPAARLETHMSTGKASNNGNQVGNSRQMTPCDEPNQPPGHIVAVRGSVVEVEFPDGLPALNEAIRVADDDPPLVLEVAYHVDSHIVRAIAMGHTEGLARGLAIARTGRPITVPVGPGTLGRLFNALGSPLDGEAPPSDCEHWPIHRPAPTLEAQRHGLEFLETGIKVIDLLAPLGAAAKPG